MELIISLASIWAPSIVAILGIITTILIAIGKTKSAIDALKDEETMKQLKEELARTVSTNEELKQQNDLILDELTKIKDYRAHLNQEKK